MNTKNTTITSDMKKIYKMGV